MPVDRENWRVVARLIGVVVAWGATFHVLTRYGVDLLPRAVARELTLEAYLSLAHLVTLGVGLGLSFAFLPDPAREIPLRPAEPRALLSTALLVPAVFAASTTVAFFVARPTLLAELMAGGRELAQKNTGQFGRELVASPVPLVILWGAVLSPVSEELFFRGALYSLVQRWFRSATPTTIVAGLMFGLVHWDMPGGLGIIRFVSALGLGFACCFARQLTGSVTAPIVLHVLYNVISVGTVRRWLVSEALPTRYGTPVLVSLLGAAGLALFAVLVVASRRRVPPGDTAS